MARQVKITGLEHVQEMDDAVGKNMAERLHAIDGADGSSVARAPRYLRAAGEEVDYSQPFARVVQGAAQVLPQFSFARLRTALWKAAKIPIGEGSMIMGDLVLSGAGDWSKLFSIGEHTYVTGPLRVNLGGAVRIGNAVNIGHDCIFLTVDHDIGPPSRRAGPAQYGNIMIGDGCWIASRVTLLPGITLGNGCIVAAGSVVTTHVAPHTMVGGVPARVIRHLDDSWTEPAATVPGSP